MDNSNKKYLYIFQALLAVLLYTVVQETMHYAFTFLLALLKGSSSSYIKNLVEYIANNGEQQFISLIALVAAGLICIPVYYKWYRYTIRFKKHIIIKEALSLKNLFLIFLAGISANLFIASIIELFSITKYFAGYEESISLLSDGNIILSTVLVVIIAPICEELLNRGIVYEKIKAQFTRLPAIIIQAAIFAIMHGNMLQIIYAFILGLLLGYIYEKYKSIYAPIFMHLLFNATTKANAYIFTDKIINNNSIMVGVCLFSGIVLFLAMKYIRNSTTIEYIQEPGFQMFDLKQLGSGDDLNV
ncbi:MAG: hypothetical protein K0R15_1963 [Clostridiales bacterium]|jgi:membrane protease YdiL (CAAX protease family)|nr:hypothetical protein [Clostridiales bacterium]